MAVDFPPPSPDMVHAFQSFRPLADPKCNPGPALSILRVGAFARAHLPAACPPRFDTGSRDGVGVGGVAATGAFGGGGGGGGRGSGGALASEPVAGVAGGLLLLSGVDEAYAFACGSGTTALAAGRAPNW